MTSVRAGLTTAAVGLLISLPCAASAGSARSISGEASLEGAHAFSTFTVEPGARLRVRPLAAPPAASGVGWLHVKANRIVIAAGATIDATGSGHGGVESDAGGAPEGTDGGGKFHETVERPGGGGAHAGVGGPGVSAACVALLGSDGGVAYADPDVFRLGAAGGAAHHLEPLWPSRGGDGGGAVVLEAAEVVIDGVIIAAGAAGLTFEGMGSGGGSGGLIRIVTPSLGGSGALDVSGGPGGLGLRSGGGGGGGLVVLAATLPLGLTIALDGGLAGDCLAGAGGPGLLVEQPAPGCVDLDGDGFPAALCGGTDCDDVDPEIHPGAVERCDGLDRSCSGVVDDPLPEGACPEGHACQGGGCVLVDDGERDAGPPPGPAPDRIEYQGGCAAGGGAPWGAGTTVTLLLLGLMARLRQISRNQAAGRKPRGQRKPGETGACVRPMTPRPRSRTES